MPAPIRVRLLLFRYATSYDPEAKGKGWHSSAISLYLSLFFSSSLAPYHTLLFRFSSLRGIAVGFVFHFRV